MDRAKRARWAVAAIFGCNGFLMGAWAPQIPPLMPRHGITESTLGLVILALGIGAVGDGRNAAGADIGAAVIDKGFVAEWQFSTGYGAVGGLKGSDNRLVGADPEGFASHFEVGFDGGVALGCQLCQQRPKLGDHYVASTGRDPSPRAIDLRQDRRLVEDFTRTDAPHKG